MKYAVIHCSNGAFTIDSEWSEMNSAIVDFHAVCTTLWHAEDVEKAAVILVNEKMETIKIEYVKY